MTDKPVKKRTPRKSNRELMQAIYGAALTILTEAGYDHVTFSSVAKRAKTARAVLYRRWQSPFALLYDAVQYFSDAQDETPESVDLTAHSLRDNLVYAVGRLRTSFQFFGTDYQFMQAFLAELSRKTPQINQIMADLRRQNLYWMDRILAQAAATGEINHPVTDDVKLVPFQLILFQAMTDPEKITDTYVENLVDQVVLPAFQAYNEGGS
ncbi:TetR/AcrR family transcriptional regulator [Levilactobacillus bambusae]|uniref:TetR/AcrR family transcriptional regulator n=1 Tax=Levilactobacillus bambusae TaxID=2024736 RepID=A0A2V1MZT5_9LACO|nr:TetR/AcrR family transcriptional regulator [Levilactobacillus bambusae]PWF99674.1 TetR/AcrR family transcriptional regulator [Levilactobacillus bambusae]